MIRPGSGRLVDGGDALNVGDGPTAADRRRVARGVAARVAAEQGYPLDQVSAGRARALAHYPHIRIGVRELLDALGLDEEAP